jgi:glycosyltransferase involved in cell wall biosynthesis
MNDLSSERCISIVIPCFNEEKYIRDCILSVLSFTTSPELTLEILILDGMSTDNTRTIVQHLSDSDTRVRLIDNPDRIQSCALNLGIRLSRGDWIMRLDAHTKYPTDYLMLCYEAAITTKTENTGGICLTQPGNDSYGAQLVQAVTTHWFGVGNSGFRTGAIAGFRDTVPFGFFHRGLFNRIGYFDERLVRTQDYEFNCRIRKSGGKIYSDPAIVSSYYNLPKLSAFLKKQFFKQGPYNAYMWYLAPYAFAPRHAVTGCFALYFWLGSLLFLLTTAHLYLWGGVMTLYLLLALTASVQQSVRYRFRRHLICLPFGFFSFHLCHGTGVLAGLGRLLIGRAPVQQIQEPWPGAGKFRAWP